MLTAEEYIERYAQANPVELALQLANEKRSDADFILRQIEGKQRLLRKLPSWTKLKNLYYPRRLSLEQCSGEAAAHYKATILERLVPSKPNILLDITGGFGVDFAFMLPVFKRGVYVEQCSDLVDMARHNFPLMNLPPIEFHCGDGVEYLKHSELVDCVFIDPARRDANGRKTFSLSDCTPDVSTLLPLLASRTRYALIKLSPMLDWREACRQLPMTTEVHIFAHRGEVKDLLLWLDFSNSEKSTEQTVFCVDADTFVFTPSEERQVEINYAQQVESFLYEPSVALLKGGAIKLIAERFNVKKLHPNTQLYTSCQLIKNFPGRIFKVLRTSNFSKKNFLTFRNGENRAQLSVRNFPESVESLRRRLKIKEGGHEHWWATTLNSDQHLLIATQRVESSFSGGDTQENNR